MHNQRLKQNDKIISINKKTTFLAQLSPSLPINPDVLQRLLAGTDIECLQCLEQLTANHSTAELKQVLFTLCHNDDNYLYMKRLRHIAAQMLERAIITTNEYQQCFTVTTYRYLSASQSNQFIDLHLRSNQQELAQCYSRAKHGSMKDIQLLATYIVKQFSHELDAPESHWRELFETAKNNNDIVVLLVPGSRNVESSSNLIFDIAVAAINVLLANKDYPTIVNVKLPRLEPPVENYASLTAEEREQISRVQDHILPDSNFYQNRGVHVIFGDDVLITAATADKVYKEAMLKGAKSFHSLYAVVIDPLIVLENPSIEAALNTATVSGKLDEVAYSIFTQEDFVPVMKSLSLILNKNNVDSLSHFMQRLPVSNVVKIYTAAMSNGYYCQRGYSDALTIVRDYLITNQAISKEGLLYG